MTVSGIPQVVREKVSRLTGSRVSVALVCDRDFSSDELAGFRRLQSGEKPDSADFSIEGRIVRYECEADEEPKWRLGFEILLVKMARSVPKPVPRTSAGIRTQAGLRKLHVG
ncbi:MAG TPA: hypothetical protein VF376_09790 [Thermoanaerobaculia bacterium]